MEAIGTSGYEAMAGVARATMTPAGVGDSRLSSPSSSTSSLANEVLGTSPDAVVCEECEDKAATIECEDCGLAYCTGCDKRRHRKGKLVFHQRKRMEETEAGADPQQWTRAHVSQWLRDHELDVFLPEVAVHGIDGAFLLSSEMETLLDSQSTASRGQKKKLLREIQKLKAETETTMVATTPSVPSPPPPSTERSSLRRMGVNLRVNVDAQPAPATEKHFSPVTAHRARLNHGQGDDLKGRVHPRRSLYAGVLACDALDEKATTPVVQLNTSEMRRGAPPPPLQIDLKISPNNNNEPVPRDLRSIRQALGGLDLDKRGVEASFDFSAEGRLQTQGFEINMDGIATAPFPTAHATTKLSPVGTREYLLMLNELGHGASGKVYKALYLPTFKLVAVKVIRVYDKKKRHQMVRELKSLYANYVPITETKTSAACDELVVFYDAYTNPEIGSVSIVLEYMDGGSLEDVMQNGGHRTEKELANLAYCVLKGLAFLHEHHQLHRDIKLSNMLINHRGQVKISDFGISRDLESTLAKAMTFTGTLLYMAPERISGGTYSYPSDIWSFGLALMASAVGQLPVPTKEGYWGVVHAVQEQPSPSLRDYGDGFSSELCDFLDQCLRKNPMQRPTASQLLQHPFIQQNYQPPSAQSREWTPLTPEQRAERLVELDAIATSVRRWCDDRASTLLSPSNDTPDKIFFQTPHDDKIHALAHQMRLPHDVVAVKFAFLDKYRPAE
ncbi:hypothetical protein Poli38472_007755 [Pythium oligandrum]|uniref:Serine/threonine protein kinase n=1 Tax=Pythium oligandrum TaxID=41045 RepID=A0A8K1FS03_PYTOL|nr:hypothetical protein Poli38472_007755 [Pythium oligandrum]|eukprot:TMW68083.1 hypothetical protein Poli38472_007755 [Pythium oligandrum]